MQITDVRIFPRAAEDTDGTKLRAFASITFDDAFVVRGLKVIEGIHGLFVAMPGRKLADGTFKDIAHPINTDTRMVISAKVLDKFHETTGDNGRAN